MADQDPDTPKEMAEASSEIALEGGSYEIIRSRLNGQGEELSARLTRLNELRREVFGSVPTVLLRAERITTDHNCVPRDMVTVGENRFLFGYNVHFGLKSEIQLSDVFAVYEYREDGFHAVETDFLAGDQFADDFKSLYKYYKNTKFVKFSFIGPYLFMVFRVGQQVSDVKTFKWLLKDSGISYIGNRSDHEFSFPKQYECDWVRTHRDLHRDGAHPHISIEDRLFVSCADGMFTAKVEDNTESGRGIYSEPVDHEDQTLDDAEIFYANIGTLILLKIRPFQEKRFRFFVFNDKLKTLEKIDALEHSCVRLPEDQGIIFSDGYYLQPGILKRFDTNKTDMLFERLVSSNNGEDYLYVFYNRMSGDYVMMSYNLISKTVDNPILCNGFSLFENGELAYFKCEEEAQKHHLIQIWQTPYVAPEYEKQANKESFLYKIGNRDVVRCMAECQDILNLIRKDETYGGLYVDIVRATSDIVDSYFWIDKEEAFNLRESLEQIKETAIRAIDEFDKVRRIRRETESTLAQVSEATSALLRGIAKSDVASIDEFVNHLAALRKARGEVISLKQLRYIDLPAVEALEERVASKNDALSQRCVEFLLEPKSLDPYRQRIETHMAMIPELMKVAEGGELQEAVKQSGEELEMLIEIVSNLKIEDATETTRLIDQITNIYSTLNQVKTALKNRISSLASVEGAAQFHAQLKLLSQSVINYLDICDTPDRCDEYLNKLTVQIEELEGRFSDFDDFILQLSNKRTEVYEAFESKKLQLVEARNKKANAMMTSAERILKVIQHRLESMAELDEINGYMAADMMIEKIRDFIRQLHELDDSVKAEELTGRLKAIQEDAVRQLRDKNELFVEGQNLIRFGEHQFPVNIQPLDLTMIHRDGHMQLHLTGTRFFQPIDDPEFLATEAVWNQESPSENESVYRAEYLAHRMLMDLVERRAVVSYLEADEDQRLSEVQAFMGPRHTEAYQRGVHDVDGERILTALAHRWRNLGLARFQPTARACAWLYWHLLENEEQKGLWEAQLRGFGERNQAFPGDEMRAEYVTALRSGIESFYEGKTLFPSESLPEAALYLFHQLCSNDPFVISQEAAGLSKAFEQHLESHRLRDAFRGIREAMKPEPVREFQLVRDWVRGFVLHSGQPEQRRFINEVVMVQFVGQFNPRQVSSEQVSGSLEGLRGSHRNIDDGRYELDYLAFTERLNQFDSIEVSLYHRYHERKQALIKDARETMRLDEYKPKVLTSFVRNQLIDQVFLPLIGDNLAKQIGVAGDSKRTDLMGLLLLISPPGYGKTTLMEYIANRLGITFVKINGPALGHQVTSLDPADAVNAAAREEVQRLNFSLELGDNIMIYVDDIQHCHPEFLQKFISLCDGQRHIEGVWEGKSRTYDLRGRKVAVVMAGNPYTESGEKFKIPDMLANRADTYNLGDIIGSHEAAFKASYLENALTSNPVLAQLNNKSRRDIQIFIKIAETGSREGMGFEADYSVEDINEILNVLTKLVRIRDTVLAVNQEYIRSAGQQDAYRTEPPFKLQGSYRNMNRLAEKTLPIMNDQEVQDLIIDHYENESQTLTSGAEANLLKFREINGWLSEADQARWEEIKKVFCRNQIMGQGDPSDPVGRVVSQLTVFGEGLQDIRKTLEERFKSLNTKPLLDLKPLAESLKTISQAIGERGTPGEASTPVQQGEASDVSPVITEFGRTLEGIRNALAKDLPQAVASVASEVSVGQLQTELTNLKEDLSIVREILKRYEAEKSQKPGKPEPGNVKEDVDLSGVTITRRTLNQIYKLIEKDEKHLEFIKANKRATGKE
ncbi:MAG: hypothetical protein M2R45_04434 [Verrucomicrobia subdivision 3 bacterium]|nr:hypothetical protein [Limisphaerales bacterium]MCS1413522.1 hypothetical protein [Limisphaerales bacterium]